ncbi:carboxypeptidase B-like [Schistocerca americana]|uniref:carboxypeptidase B-like n=1 Tax=Schistocerca americana TaxID=7009 RepID=UPI001F4FFECE|nr:carboxypeptidase B-like [Schistocerca americana]
MVDPSLKSDFLDYLRKNGIKHSVYIENVASFRNTDAIGSSFRHPSALPPDLFSVYLSHQQMSNYLDLLAKKYPPLVHVQAFGTSFEKRRLDMVKISTEKSGVEKPIILIDAGIHAREWIAPAMALFIINQLAENETNRYLTEEIEWHICPLLNPDGYEYSRKTDMWWRKTRSHTKNKHCRGVDGNRNFDFHWNECGASSDPCSGCYAGEKPFSEVETQAFRAYVMSIRDRLKLYLTFHSYGPVLVPNFQNNFPFLNAHFDKFLL